MHIHAQKNSIKRCRVKPFSTNHPSCINTDNGLKFETVTSCESLNMRTAVYWRPRSLQGAQNLSWLSMRFAEANTAFLYWSVSLCCCKATRRSLIAALVEEAGCAALARVLLVARSACAAGICSQRCESNT